MQAEGDITHSKAANERSNAVTFQFSWLQNDKYSQDVENKTEYSDNYASEGGHKGWRIAKRRDGSHPSNSIARLKLPLWQIDKSLKNWEFSWESLKRTSTHHQFYLKTLANWWRFYIRGILIRYLHIVSCVFFPTQFLDDKEVICASLKCLFEIKIYIGSNEVFWFWALLWMQLLFSGKILGA